MDLSAQVVTGVFALAGVGVAFFLNARTTRETRAHEDRVRFHEARLESAAMLLDSAGNYRRAILAVSAFSEGQLGSPPHVTWADEMQHQFLAYHAARARFDLLFPASVRDEVRTLADRLNDLRAAARPAADLDAPNSQAREAAEQVATACREWMGSAN